MTHFKNCAHILNICPPFEEIKNPHSEHGICAVNLFICDVYRLKVKN